MEERPAPAGSVPKQAAARKKRSDRRHCCILPATIDRLSDSAGRVGLDPSPDGCVLQATIVLLSGSFGLLRTCPLCGIAVFYELLLTGCRTRSDSSDHFGLARLIENIVFYKQLLSNIRTHVGLVGLACLLEKHCFYKQLLSNIRTHLGLVGLLRTRSFDRKALLLQAIIVQHTDSPR